MFVDDSVEIWLNNLIHTDPRTFELVAAAIDMLENEGPTLGRPLVDRIKGARHHHMKELRPGSSGWSQIRILFAFDQQRNAVLLAAGDKAGDWNRWYRKNIPLADERFIQHQATSDNTLRGR